MSKMKIEKDNVVLLIEEEDLKQYEARGYSKVGAKKVAPAELEKEIKSLSEKTEELSKSNEKLTAEKEELSKSNEKLTVDVTKLTKEKESLTKEIEDLKKKIK